VVLKLWASSASGATRMAGDCGNSSIPKRSSPIGAMSAGVPPPGIGGPKGAAQKGARRAGGIALRRRAVIIAQSGGSRTVPCEFTALRGGRLHLIAVAVSPVNGPNRQY
jgi:hypothetical protein